VWSFSNYRPAMRRLIFRRFSRISELNDAEYYDFATARHLLLGSKNNKIEE
jgi:hypothetical protein